MNIMITGEEYNEYEAQKDKIKDLEMSNEFLRGKFDDLYVENVERVKKCDALEEQVDHWKMQVESTYENYQQALSEKVALIKERDRLTNIVHSQGSEIGNLRATNKALKAEKEALLWECDRLDKKHEEYECLKAKDDKISDLCGQLDKALKERNEYKELYMKQIIKCNEPRFENDKVSNELESVKAKIKEPVASITINPCRDSEEAYSPDNNTVIKIKNLYVNFTNNYFSEEDEDNE